MKIACIGGGPAGLYFAILMKKLDPSCEVVVHERNRPDDTFGFGVVFSDATLAQLGQVDPESYAEIAASFYHWDDIDVHYRGQVLTSTGHGFSGMSRRLLLQILHRRAEALGVRLDFEHEVREPPQADLVLIADGVNSATRARFDFGTRVDLRPNRFVWLGTTCPFPAFTFYFRQNEHGLFRVHAYQYAASAPEGEPLSTFIVECTEDTWKSAGLDRASEADTLAFCQALFADELRGHKLLANRSVWRQFPTIRNDRWHLASGTSQLVLVGDAAHTAHFSIGSGTKLAMEDAIALVDAIGRSPGDLPGALRRYEAERRAGVDAVQRAAQVSLAWFEETERYFEKLDPLPFAFSMLTRSLRITHANLKVRDPAFVRRVDDAFAKKHGCDDGRPPMFVPLTLRGLTLPNRVAVSPMCQYSAEDGLPNDWHLVHLGSRAVGGAGLIVTEMTDVSAEGRISPGCTGLYNDPQEAAWRRVVDFVHQHSPAKIAVQLGHAGRKASTRRMWEGIDLPLPEGNWPIVSASPLPYFPGKSQVPRPLDQRGMDEIRDQFAQAAERAERAGFDMVELHMAHGYLLASFLSPLTNRRDDAYGGSLENRLRWPLAVLRAVRSVWKTKPLSVRVSATDWAPDGVSPAESVLIAQALVAEGADIIDVSSGQTVPEGKPVYGRLYQTPLADRIRNEARVPVMTVGNVSSWADANSILAAERADLVLLARGHLYDPYWTRHAAYEQGYALPWPPQYDPARSFTPRES